MSLAECPKTGINVTKPNACESSATLIFLNTSPVEKTCGCHGIIRT